ncbi:hypothetical protein [Methyloversatilis sp.]|uniref:hypothetical protein n=1 Tax=Methyloversatilis sp. TaxID=2569862 RepID=UPI0027B9973D|nr:hypothetical protein [Methyloversatilis sp.]
MRCALCHCDASLRNSHIIPEFLYRSLYDEKHRFQQISTDAKTQTVYLQKGLREQLLCETCEQRLSVWERYVSMLLSGGVDVAGRRTGDRLYLAELDYRKVKLFQLSVLWRAGVSSLPTFSQVQLGPHEERIRTMLLTEDPGSTTTYGCIMFMLVHGHERVQDLLVPPTWARFVGQKSYRFVFGGLVFLYLVSSTKPPSFVADHLLQERGTAIVKLQQMSQMRYLVDTASKMHNLGKLVLKREEL